MIKKILPIIVIFMTLSVASPYYLATAQSSQSLGTVITSTINGVKTALQNVKSGTAAYQQLSGSLTYLNVAQKLYKLMSKKAPILQGGDELRKVH